MRSNGAENTDSCDYYEPEDSADKDQVRVDQHRIRRCGGGGGDVLDRPQPMSHSDLDSLEKLMRTVKREEQLMRPVIRAEQPRREGQLVKPVSWKRLIKLLETENGVRNTWLHQLEVKGAHFNALIVMILRHFIHA